MKRDSKFLALAAIGALASIAPAQQLTTQAMAAYDGPGGFQQIFDNGTSNPLETRAFASYDENSDEGPRQGYTETWSVANYGHLSTTHTFSVDNARYTYLNGTAQATSFDTLTLTNGFGVSGGRYKLRVDLTRSGTATAKAAVTFGSYFQSNITASTSFETAEMNFTYGESIDATLGLSTEAQQQFDSFEYNTRTAGFDVSLSFILTDTGGLNLSDIGQQTASGLGYSVTTQAVPEPATVGILAVGVVGMLKRRRR